MADITAGLITNSGKKALNAMLYDSTATSAIYLAYGTGTTAVAAGDTALVTEVERAEADTAKKVGSDFVVEHEFTATGACTISEIGVFDAAATTTGTPICTGGNTYYIVWDADYTVSGDNFIWVVCRDSSLYANGTFYQIDGSDNWTDQSIDAMFTVYGKEITSGNEESLASQTLFTGNATNYGLRMSAAKTKFGQSFKIAGTDSYYITKVGWKTRKIGSPTGDAWIEIHSDTSGTQVGVDSTTIDVSTIGTGWENRAHWDVTPAVGGGTLIYRAVAAAGDRVTVAAGETYKATVTLTPEQGSY